MLLLHGLEKSPGADDDVDRGLPVSFHPPRVSIRYRQGKTEDLVKVRVGAAKMTRKLKLILVSFYEVRLL